MHVSKLDQGLDKKDADLSASLLFLGEKKGIFAFLVFLFLILFNYLVADKVSANFGLEGFKKSISDMDNLALLSALVIAPLLEESLFRYSLTKGNNYKYFIYLLMCVLIVLFINIWSGIILLLGFSVLAYLHFSLFKTESRFQFIIFLFMSAITFSIVHIPAINGENIFINMYVVSLSLFPIGLFFCIIRNDFGFGFAIFTHFTYNLLTISLNEIIY